MGGEVVSQRVQCLFRIEKARWEHHVKGESSSKRIVSCDMGAMLCMPGVAPGAMVRMMSGRPPESKMVDWAFQLHKPRATPCELPAWPQPVVRLLMYSPRERYDPQERAEHRNQARTAGGLQTVAQTRDKPETAKTGRHPEQAVFVSKRPMMHKHYYSPAGTRAHC
jgi:hypothetical protein